MQKAPSHSVLTDLVKDTYAHDEVSLYCAIDLGTNNCRMMIASFHQGQFKIIESFSRIVRLGENLERTKKLSDTSQMRTMVALKQCAEKIAKYKTIKIKAVATQACRTARNSKAFLTRILRETGIEFRIITAQEEAQLSVRGCASLLDEPCEAAIVIDVGGGSTEISWLDMSAITKRQDDNNHLGNNNHLGQSLRLSKFSPKPVAWISIAKGVVNLSERFPHDASLDQKAWFKAMVEDVRQDLIGFTKADCLRPAFDKGNVYIVGTSGAITSLAGMHLGLIRYDRSKVDGLWISHKSCGEVVDRLLEMGAEGRASEPCIGRDRAHLVIAGAAILEALLSLWPSPKLRVADRGLREGLLLSMVKKKSRRRKRTKHRSVDISPTLDHNLSR